MLGTLAEFDNVYGNGNTGVGSHALASNVGGSENIAIGDSAGVNARGVSNNIEIANAGTFRDDRAIRIGTTRDSRENVRRRKQWCNRRGWSGGDD